MKNLYFAGIIALALVFAFTTVSCTKIGSIVAIIGGGKTDNPEISNDKAVGGQTSGGGKTVKSAEELKEYLDSQPSSSPDKPIKVKISVNDLMLKSVVDAIKSAGKFVSLDLSDSPLKSIPNGAFKDCSTLAGITMPGSVTSIGNNAFNDCTGLTSVTIGKDVTKISNVAFSGCTRLTAINVAADNTKYSSQDGVLYNKNKTELIVYPAAKKGAFTVPDSINRIWNDSFTDCSSLTSVTIGNNVTSIMKGAFRNCTSLTSVSIGARVTSIEKEAFRDCNNLTSVTFASLIPSNNFHNEAFSGPGRTLRDKYLATSGGRGTYTRASGSNKWTKQ